MNDITREELKVWKLYGEEEYKPPPMPVYKTIFQHASLDPVKPFEEFDFAIGTRAPRRSYIMQPHELDINLNTLWPAGRGIPQGVNAFSLENRRKALAILLDIPEEKLEAVDIRGWEGY